MSDERPNATTMRGRPLTLLGPEIRVGQPAPSARVLAQDLSEITVGHTRGETQILLTIPSVDTPVCSAETKRFNDEAGRRSGIAVKVVSVDLPFALKRWCGSEGVENLQLLSDHRAAEFGERYGTLIKELRLLSRAAFVVDRNNQVVYAEYVPEIANHPDYEAILDAARRAAAP